MVAIALISAHPDTAARGPTGDFADGFWRQLAAVRAERKVQVVAYLEGARDLAESILDDAIMADAFCSLIDRGEPDPHTDLMLDRHYVTRYGDFFDILFVDHTGYVFHSMRRESDYHTHLFEGPLSSTRLAREMPDVHGTTFIDYEFYPPSDEPAAFFAVPVREARSRAATANRARLLGWFVLQCPLNKLNSICSDRRGLGRTGEVYLVNTSKRMMTSSRFRRDPTALQLRVETSAIAKALEVGNGQEVIEDYRGVRVLSSFERFDLLGTPWIIVAEIDEAEVITQHHRQHTAFYASRICSRLGDAPVSSQVPTPELERLRRVDMNEYARVAGHDSLVTNGVSACTAVAVVLPGRFGYLAHVGPGDRIYGEPDRGHNDCLGKMLRQIQRYDVYPCEIPELEFTIVAVHQESWAGVVRRLTDLGVELSQIRFAYNPDVQYANVFLTAGSTSPLVQWVTPRGASVTILASRIESLGEVVAALASKPR